MTQEEIKRGISPFDSKVWIEMRDARRRREVKRYEEGKKRALERRKYGLEKVPKGGSTIKGFNSQLWALIKNKKSRE